MKYFYCTRGFSSSINFDEVQKFSKIGRQWWDLNSKAGASPLHTMNPVRVNYIRTQLSEKLSKQDLFATEQIKGLDILDVGCGGGLLAESLARLGANVTGIDPSPHNISIASAHCQKDPMTSAIIYKQETIESLSQSEAEKYDVITLLEVIEHVDMPLSFLSSCSKCLKKGGSMFVSTMNRSAKAYFITILAAETVLKIVPQGTHDWQKYIRPTDLSIMLNTPSVGITVNDISGLVATPNVLSGMIHWKISKTDTDVNYILHGIKL